MGVGVGWHTGAPGHSANGGRPQTRPRPSPQAALALRGPGLRLGTHQTRRHTPGGPKPPTPAAGPGRGGGPWGTPSWGGPFRGISYDPSLHCPPQPSQRRTLLWASKPFIRTLTALPSECFSESQISLQGPRRAGLLCACSCADNFACFNSLDPHSLPVREALLCLLLKT